MSKDKLTIGSPEKYISKSVDASGRRKERVAYQVTGSPEAIEQYNADMLARTGKVSVDTKTGNPLFTIALEQFAKSGVKAEIQRGSKADETGNFNWFVDTTEKAEMAKALANASPEVKAIVAQNEYDAIVAGIKAMRANKSAKADVPATTEKL